MFFVPIMLIAAPPATTAVLPIIFTNEDRAYCDREAGRKAPRRVSIFLKPAKPSHDTLTFMDEKSTGTR